MKQAQVHGANMATKSAKADQVKEEYEESVNRMNMARVGVQCYSGHHYQPEKYIYVKVDHREIRRNSCILGKFRPSFIFAL